jgi:hypothetical protein
VQWGVIDSYAAHHTKRIDHEGFGKADSVALTPAAKRRSVDAEA